MISSLYSVSKPCSMMHNPEANMLSKNQWQNADAKITMEPIIIGGGEGVGERGHRPPLLLKNILGGTAKRKEKKL